MLATANDCKDEGYGTTNHWFERTVLSITENYLTQPHSEGHVLCYSPSSVAELEALLKVFQNPDSLIVAVFLDPELRYKAAEHFAEQKRVCVQDPADFSQFLKTQAALRRGKAFEFDFISAWNVFRRKTKAGDELAIEKPLGFAQFAKVLSALATKLAPGGCLFLFGTNYSAKDVDVPGCALHQLGMDCGPVTMFELESGCALPRSRANTYLLQRYFELA